MNVEREIVIGRQGADLTIPDPEISRRHTLVRPAADGIVVEDLGSKNGTHVDGMRITGPVMLGSGGTISLGGTELCLEPDASTTVITTSSSPRGVVRRVDEPPAAAPGSSEQRPRPPVGMRAPRHRGRLKLAVLLGSAIAIAAAAAAVLVFVTDSSRAKRRGLAVSVSATRVSFRGRRELLFGDQSGSPTGPGTARVELTFAVAPKQIRGPTAVTGKIISRFDAGSVRSTFRATVTPSRDGSARVAGRGTIIGGAGGFEGASGSYALVAVVPARSTSAQFRMNGTIEY